MEDFIRKIILENAQTTQKKVHTRFPPEPNGYLHIGHAKSIVLNFGVAKEFGGVCNLRFDDTNPEKENIEYVESIKADIQWLGYDWAEREYYASDYFNMFYNYAVSLIKKELAYVDFSSVEEIKSQRGTLTEQGVPSSYRNTAIDENLHRFENMKEGKYQEGECVLRAKIDMASPNIVMRDPPIYRIRNRAHHRQKNTWCIYPMYDFAHCLSDAIEGITHSLCTLEFEIHRPLYDWFLKVLDIPQPRPQQIEFARLNLTHTMLSKRVLKILVDKKIVSGWDDPRLPTLSGIKRRGYSPRAIKNFCKDIGVTKTNATLEIERLEESVREDLNLRALRMMVVFNPLKLVITNYPEDKVEYFQVPDNPEDPQSATHTIEFSRVLYIEQEDFMESPPKKYFRLAPGAEIRLKYAYYIKCTKVIKNDAGNVVEIHAEYDPDSYGGWTKDGRKVKGTLHWVSCNSCQDVSLYMFERLFMSPHPELQCKTPQDILSVVNRNSRTALRAKAEKYLVECVKSLDTREDKTLYFQFLRKGYFVYDEKYSKELKCPVFNNTVNLKSKWQKKQ